MLEKRTFGGSKNMLTEELQLLQHGDICPPRPQGVARACVFKHENIIDVTLKSNLDGDRIKE